METPKITKEEWNRLKMYKPLISFDKNQEVDMVNLCRLYVNPHASYCGGCRNSLQEIKQELYSWFNQNESDYNLFFDVT